MKMPSAHLSLKEEEVIKLALEFLQNRDLHISQVSLERETGVINGCYSDDLLFLRQLILDGQWDDAVEFIQPLESIERFDKRRFRYLILKHKYVELLCIKSEAGAVPSKDAAVEEVVKVLNELEHYCVSKEDYSNLCLLLTLPRLSDHLDYRDWNPSSARVQCFKSILPLVENFLPPNKKYVNIDNQAKCDRLMQLIIKGLLYESCVDYCQQKATCPTEETKEMVFSKLLNGNGFSDSDLSLLSWLQSIPSETFSCPFEQKTLNVDVERMDKPCLEASWTEHMLVTPIKPNIFPHSAMPYTRPKSTDIMSKSLLPAMEGLPYGLGMNRSVTSKNFKDVNVMSKSFASFHLSNKKSMTTSVDKLFEDADTMNVSSYTELPPISESPSREEQAGQQGSAKFEDKFVDSINAKINESALDLVSSRGDLLKEFTKQKRYQDHFPKHINFGPNQIIPNKAPVAPPQYEQMKSQMIDVRPVYHTPPYAPPRYPVAAGIQAPIKGDAVAVGDILTFPRNSSHPGTGCEGDEIIVATLSSTRSTANTSVNSDRSGPLSTCAMDNDRAVSMLNDLFDGLRLHKGGSSLFPAQKGDGRRSSVDARLEGRRGSHDSRQTYHEGPFSLSRGSEGDQRRGSIGGLPHQKDCNLFNRRPSLLSVPVASARTVRAHSPLRSEGRDPHDIRRFSVDSLDGRRDSLVTTTIHLEGCIEEEDENQQPPPVNGTAGKPHFIPVTTLEDVQAVRCAEFHPFGKLYAVGSNSKTLRICSYPKLSDLRSDHETYPPTVLFKRTKHHKGSIYCLAWSPVGDLIATGSNDKTIKLMRFNADNCNMEGQEIELTMHDGTVRDLCFIEDISNKSSLLVSGGAGDCKIYITDCATGTPFQAMTGHSGHILTLHTWGGAMFLSGSQDRTVRFWDLRSRGCVNVISPQTMTKSSPVAAACVDPSGRLLVTGHEDSSCVLYDIRGARGIQCFKPHSADIRTIRFSPNAYYLLTGGYDNKLVLTDLQGDLTMPLPSVIVAEHQDKVISGRWHPQEFSFVSTSADKTSTLWALPPV